MAKVALLYERVVYVVTGSGIGPCLGQILAARVPARLVWSTRDPRATYGDALVDEVEAAQPDAVIWDTTQRGQARPRRSSPTQACRDFDAEAVFVVSNKAGDAAPRPRPRAARHPGLRADLGLLTRTPASTLSGMRRCRPWTWDEIGIWRRRHDGADAVAEIEALGYGDAVGRRQPVAGAGARRSWSDRAR